jgi:hypothetical protein
MRLYDIKTDEFREPTQADIDHLALAEAAHGVMVVGVRTLIEVCQTIAKGEAPPFDVGSAIRIGLSHAITRGEAPDG